MKRAFSNVFCLLLFLCNARGQASPAPSDTATPEEAKKLAAMTVEDLISKLQEESKPGMGTDALARCDPGDFRFQGGAFRPERQTVSPVMRELISRGVNVLPALIAHITDARPTKFTIGETLPGGDKLALWLASDYDARDHRPSKEREGISTDPYSVHTFKQVHEYTLKVGDFCFVAVGQIVNRDLHALRYMAPLQVVINTPVEVPVLAAAVKADWGGLTPEDHEKSLEADALRRADPEALKMLSLYYPKAFDAPAVKLLNRPLYVSGTAGDFFTKSLLPEKDADKRVQLIVQFREKNGDANYFGLLKDLIWTSTWTVTMEKDDPSKVAANEILADAFPNVDPYDPPFINAASYGEQSEFIERLGQVPSKTVDETVTEMLRQVSEEKKDVKFDLALSCSKRLLGKPAYENAIRVSLKKIIATQNDAIEQAHGMFAGYGDDWGVRRMQDILNKLPKQETEKSSGH